MLGFVCRAPITLLCTRRIRFNKLLPRSAPWHAFKARSWWRWRFRKRTGRFNKGKTTRGISMPSTHFAANLNLYNNNGYSTRPNIEISAQNNAVRCFEELDYWLHSAAMACVLVLLLSGCHLSLNSSFHRRLFYLLLSFVHLPPKMIINLVTLRHKLSKWHMEDVFCTCRSLKLIKPCEPVPKCNVSASLENVLISFVAVC